MGDDYRRIRIFALQTAQPGVDRKIVVSKDIGERFRKARLRGVPESSDQTSGLGSQLWGDGDHREHEHPEVAAGERVLAEHLLP